MNKIEDRENLNELKIKVFHIRVWERSFSINCEKSSCYDIDLPSSFIMQRQFRHIFPAHKQWIIIVIINILAAATVTVHESYSLPLSPPLSRCCCSWNIFLLVLRCFLICFVEILSVSVLSSSSSLLGVEWKYEKSKLGEISSVVFLLSRAISLLHDRKERFWLECGKVCQMQHVKVARIISLRYSSLLGPTFFPSSPFLFFLFFCWCCCCFLILSLLYKSLSLTRLYNINITFNFVTLFSLSQRAQQ